MMSDTNSEESTQTKFDNASNNECEFDMKTQSFKK
jgi:hypothetical protein